MGMNRQKTLKRLLRSKGIEFVSVVQGKSHIKVRLANERLVSTAITPSCPYADENFLRDVRKAMQT
tara:strand:+ start:6599 stop:6796 length:198 start_codon:yes stop_codon:yes gene_type:complete